MNESNTKCKEDTALSMPDRNVDGTKVIINREVGRAGWMSSRIWGILS